MRANLSELCSARYVVLLPIHDAHDFPAELDDEDGRIVGHLARAGTPCRPPPALPLPRIGTDGAARIQCDTPR